MNAKHQTEAWLFYGACDLYFSFHSEEWVFDYHSAFFAIMALEKHLKAFLIHSKASDSKNLGENNSFEKALDIGKSYGHDFPRMANDVEKLFPDNSFSKILNRSHDTYKGRDLVMVLKDSYLETRYPTKRHVSMSFPVGQPNVYLNPLSSSGLHHFIQACCNTILDGLSENIELGRILINLQEQYKHIESFSRFQNIYSPNKWA